MGKIDHSTAGAIHAIQKNKCIGKILSYAIAGHHAGLSDWREDKAGGRPLHERLENGNPHLKQALQGCPPQEILGIRIPPTTRPCISGVNPQEYIHLWIRMLFSCLIDADRLDTEAFMNPERVQQRENLISMAELKKRFDSFMQKKQASALSSPINEKRKLILERCKQMGREKQPGIFSLTVPTGGGKTLASIGFALEHALQYGKKRIIVVIPYTSIIEQTAEVLKNVFGEDVVLEHHSNLDPEKETIKSRLATENWDASIIVTTNVQFFESLFAARASACRKMHNIVNSVVILDEAQTLPTDFLKPIISSMKGLSQAFKTTFVLCTATQPVLDRTIGEGEAQLNGFQNVTEIMEDPNALYQDFQRVTVNNETGDNISPSTLEKIAERIANERQVLCIVNTRKQCQELFNLVQAKSNDGVEVLHLSALMCPEHRSDIVAEIKEKLIQNQPLRLISTQVVEAGVDIDFPVVYRELAGLDSIAQAAGRCNREGKLCQKGSVYIFQLEGNAHGGRFSKAQNACKTTFRCNIQQGNELAPKSFEAYFIHYFSGLNSFDKNGIIQLLTQDAPSGCIQFRTAELLFKLIENINQHPIIVQYQGKRGKRVNSNHLIEELKRTGISKKLMRKLQRFTVSVYDKEFEHLREQGAIEEMMGLWVQVRDEIYDPKIGLNTNTVLEQIF